MPVKFKIKVGKVGNSIRIVIPKEIAQHVKLEKGDTVEMWADNSNIIVARVKKPVPP